MTPGLMLSFYLQNAKVLFLEEDEKLVDKAVGLVERTMDNCNSIDTFVDSMHMFAEFAGEDFRAVIFTQSAYIVLHIDGRYK